MPVPIPSARLPPPHVHLQRRHALGVRLVTGILADRSNLVTVKFFRPVALLARLPCRTQRLDGRWDGGGDLAGGHVPELARSGELGFNQGPHARPDVTRHAGNARVRRHLIRLILRLHRRVAGLAAELGGLHVVHPAIGGQRHDEEINQREREAAGKDRPLAAITEIDDRPFHHRPGVATSPRVPPQAGGDQQQAENEQPGHRDEHQQPDVRICEGPERLEEQQGKEQQPHRRRDGGADNRNRVAGSSRQSDRRGHVDRGSYFFRV
jgi:hypothetical protein